MRRSSSDKSLRFWETEILDSVWNAAKQADNFLNSNKSTDYDHKEIGKALINAAEAIEGTEFKELVFTANEISYEFPIP